MDQTSPDSLMAMMQSMMPPRPPPLTLDDSTRALYERAVADPSTLSDEERRKVLQRPPQEEEDSLCYDICGSTMSELVTKARRDPASLTYTEADLVIAGVPRNRDSDMLQQSRRLRGAEKDLYYKALNAAKTEDEVAALKFCQAKQFEKQDACDASREALDSSDTHLVKKALNQNRPVQWQEHIMSLSGSTKTRAPCGFVVFYPKYEDAECSIFKKRLETSVSHGLHRYLGALKESILNGFKLHDIGYDSLDSLQNCFVMMRDAGNIPSSLRQDVFLYVDNESIRSLESTRPFIWLWEPQHITDLKEQPGPLKVDIKHVAPLLLMRLTQRNMLLDKRQLRMWHDGPELENLHKDAFESKENGEYDGIWPPRTLAM
ncbi:unnamed protein product [Fusarium equiseti]|uniref:Uncharacterized protein n=1 Tax=Fusarium equiseti TaxID=61235 RepID=A0A8J2IT50_FUSEQ|nr:unnamed protein product [Fusarium equiseti]